MGRKKINNSSLIQILEINMFYKKILLLLLASLSIYKNGISMQRTKIEDLPINPLELITSHLDIDDLPNCVVQNKKFARAAIKTFFKKISALVTPHQTDQTTRLKAQDACVQHIAQLFKKLPDEIGRAHV